MLYVDSQVKKIDQITVILCVWTVPYIGLVLNTFLIIFVQYKSNPINGKQDILKNVLA